MQQESDDALHELRNEPWPLIRWILAFPNNVGQSAEAVVPEGEQLVREDVCRVEGPQLRKPSLTCHPLGYTPPTHPPPTR